MIIDLLPRFVLAGRGPRRAVLAVALAVVVALVAFLPAAVGSAAAPPSSVSFDPEPLGSWAAVGNTLNADPGVWTGGPTSITAQWFRCDASGGQCAAIAGGNSLAWTLVAGDLGKSLFARVTARNAYGARSVSTYLTGVIGAPTVTAEPVISGDPNVDGSTLTVSTGTWTGSPTAYDYQWFSCSSSTFDCTPLAGATSASYQVDDTALSGDYLTVDVDASDAFGSATNIAEPSFATGIARSDVIGPFVTAPQAVISPSWIGDASKAGNVLVGDRGVWADRPTTFYYQWSDCPDESLNNCTQIPGATSLTYVVQPSDQGKAIAFSVEAQNLAGIGPNYVGSGSLINNTYASNSGPAWAPEPSVPPQLTGDAEGVGSVMHVDASWTAPQDSNISVDYQWVRCDGNDANCVAITDATSSDYTLTQSDLGSTLYAIVEGTNSYGTTAAASTTITPSIGAPVSADSPEISGDTSASGDTLTVSNGTWTNSPSSYAYQWFSCDVNGFNCTSIAGATTSSYETVGADIGSTLFAEVDATNGYGTTTAFSGQSDVVGAPFETVEPVLSSTDQTVDGSPIAELGDTLELSQGTWSGNPTGFAYQWYRCDPTSPTSADFTNCSPIGGASSAGYTTTTDDLGHTIYVELSATNGTGTTSVDAHTLGSVGVPQPLLDDGSISGTPQVGATLTLVNGSSWAGDTPITWSYFWKRCDSTGNGCAKISGATSQTYTLTSDDQGHVVQGVVSGSNVWGGNGWGLAYDSAVIAAGSGGGGGGGSGGSVPNLKVTWAASTANPAPGGEDDFTVSVANLGGAGALQTHLKITLPATLTLLGPPYYQRGSGCTGTQVLDCNLDYIPNGSSTVVKFSTKVSGSGAQLLTATVTSDRESDPSDNTATDTIQVGGGSPTPPTPTPTPSLAKPLLKQVNARVLSGVHHARAESVDGSFTANEPLKLTMSVTPHAATRNIQLLKGTRFAGVSTRAATTTAITRSITSRGTFTFHAVIARATLTAGKLYTIHITGKNAHGKTASLIIAFRA